MRNIRICDTDYLVHPIQGIPWGKVKQKAESASNLNTFAVPVAASITSFASFWSFLQKYKNGEEARHTKSEGAGESESNSVI